MKRQPHLKVIEIFASIQGESTLQGLPCVFVRLSGCNLRCRYCDTVYAYEGGEYLRTKEIVSRVREYSIGLVCVTGGEPLLQEDTPELVRDLLSNGLRVSVETNGSLDVTSLPEKTVRVIDIKCPGSGESGSLLHRNLEDIRPTDEFKFVLSGRDDFEFAQRFAVEHHLAERATVLFAPVWYVLEPSVLAEWIVREMPEARLNLQLHKYLWPGDPRGK